jgi:hypothetical protein
MGCAGQQTTSDQGVVEIALIRCELETNDGGVHRICYRISKYGVERWLLHNPRSFIS